MNVNIVQGIHSISTKNFLYVKDGYVFAEETQLLAILSHGNWNYIHEFIVSGQLSKFFNNATILLKINANFSIEFHSVKGNTTYGNQKPIPSSEDEIFFDVKNNFLYQWDGKSWNIIVGVILGKIENGKLNSANKGSWFNINRNIVVNKIFFDDRNAVKRVLTDNGFRFAIIGEEKKHNIWLHLENDILRTHQPNDIGKFKCVSFNDGRFIQTDNKKLNYPVHGLTLSDVGEDFEILTEGFITNEDWNWNIKKYTKLFLGDNGELTPIVPYDTAIQRVGYVYDTKTVYFKPELQILVNPPEFLEVL